MLRKAPMLAMNAAVCGQRGQNTFTDRCFLSFRRIVITLRKLFSPDSKPHNEVPGFKRDTTSVVEKCVTTWQKLQFAKWALGAGSMHSHVKILHFRGERPTDWYKNTTVSEVKCTHSMSKQSLQSHPSIFFHSSNAGSQLCWSLKLQFQWFNTMLLSPN